MSYIFSIADEFRVASLADRLYAQTILHLNGRAHKGVRMRRMWGDRLHLSIVLGKEVRTLN